MNSYKPLFIAIILLALSSFSAFAGNCNTIYQGNPIQKAGGLPMTDSSGNPLSLQEGSQVYDWGSKSMLVCNGTAFATMASPSAAATNTMGASIKTFGPCTDGSCPYSLPTDGSYSYVSFDSDCKAKCESGNASVTYQFTDGSRVLFSGTACFAGGVDHDQTNESAGTVVIPRVTGATNLNLTVTNCDSSSTSTVNLLGNAAAPSPSPTPTPATTVYTTGQGGPQGSQCFASGQCENGYGTATACPSGYIDQGVQTACGNPNYPGTNQTLQIFYNQNHWGCNPQSYVEGVSVRTCTYGSGGVGNGSGGSGNSPTQGSATGGGSHPTKAANN